MIEQPKTITVRVLRPFTFNGGIAAIGDVLTLGPAFASEMLSARKVERVAAGVPKPAKTEVINPPVVELAPATVIRKGKK